MSKHWAIGIDSKGNPERVDLEEIYSVGQFPRGLELNGMDREPGTELRI